MADVFPGWVCSGVARIAPWGPGHAPARGAYEHWGTIPNSNDEYMIATCTGCGATILGPFQDAHWVALFLIEEEPF